jgi:hypothetical protein
MVVFYKKGRNWEKEELVSRFHGNDNPSISPLTKGGINGEEMGNKNRDTSQYFVKRIRRQLL